MATNASTVDFIQDQLSSLRGISARKMFGEYALYYDGNVVGLVCDNTLFIKITEEGKLFASTYYQEGFPYKGAKPAIKIEGDRLEDAMWLTELVRITAKHLPKRVPKKLKRRI